ncbi:hypothetical protein [Noviherbaspirillum aridicola]|uniref:Uncharacterized protein n=1 Tax=Noviherbaspirillum aridicola TaxID=2849687 RepID=A0ABQ4Q0E8_9BURK|nr:hypothetical protein [Noviherbaspirillum aridicola]GIZ50507.1 hypothetical protein NCCP691_05210 [Noviherbaspirillum aridicola]
MTTDEILLTALKSLAVGLMLGAVAYRMKGRSFIGWAAIGGAAAAIFPGLSLLALMALALLPAKKR